MNRYNKTNMREKKREKEWDAKEKKWEWQREGVSKKKTCSTAMHDYETHLSVNVNSAHEYDEFSLFAWEYVAVIAVKGTAYYMIMVKYACYQVRYSYSTHIHTADLVIPSWLMLEKYSCEFFMESVFLCLRFARREVSLHVAVCACAIRLLYKRHRILGTSQFSSRLKFHQEREREIFASKRFPRKGDIVLILCTVNTS